MEQISYSSMVNLNMHAVPLATHHDIEFEHFRLLDDLMKRYNEKL